MNIVITGATKGIGRAIAAKFARQGWNVAFCSRTAADVEITQLELQGMHEGIEVIGETCDVASKEALKTFAETIKSKWDRVDVLVNNAGIFFPGDVTEEEDGVLEKTMATNLYSAYYFTRYLLPLMTGHKAGHIFNLSSIAGLQAYPNGGSYSISKFALQGFSKNLRRELMPHNIAVTSVVPGAVYTPSWEAAGLPESRFIAAKDIAAMVYEITQLTNRAVVEEILVRPMQGDI